jgi:hypothetical protein
MGYDDLKSHRGKRYSGMQVGRTHVWEYPNGEWRERKLTPDLWQFAFASAKHRKGRGAPQGSGVPEGTGYQWFVEAHQFVRKVDANTYTTYMEGLKHKVAHQRAGWEDWSTDRSGPWDEARMVAILEEALANLKGEPLPAPSKRRPTRARKGMPPAEAEA